MNDDDLSILLVEDDRFQLEAVADNLELEGFYVRRACDADQAFRLLEEEANALDIGILDIDLPGGTDGIGLLEAMRLRWPRIDVIMLSGKATVTHAVDALNLGATSFLCKPCDPDLLVRTIRNTHGNRLVQDQNRRMLRELTALRNARLADRFPMPPCPDFAQATTEVDTLCHELRNCLLVLEGNLLFLDEDSALPGPARQTVQRLVQVSERLNRIIQKAEDETSRRRPPPLREGIEAARLVSDLAEQTACIARMRNIMLRVDVSGGPYPILGDRARLEQVFTNIALNAIDIMGHGGRLTVDASVPEGLFPPVVRIRFRDTGPGIPAEHLTRIFERSFSARKGGKGLGLYLARQVAEEHGGRCLAGNWDDGAEFVVELPLAEEVVS